MAINFADGQQDGRARILQIKHAVTNTEYVSNSTSWVNTGLFSLQFDNNIRSDSHVFAMIRLSYGEDVSNGWAVPVYWTLYENTDGNIADSNKGMWGGECGMGNNNTQYSQRSGSGYRIYNPSVTSPTFKLYQKTDYAFNRYVGRAGNAGSDRSTGQTSIIIMEINV
tara:strand:- start:440 stop:940 length:501 start_codon:yes stop_codon:yes gene_type:complete